MAVLPFTLGAMAGPLAAQAVLKGRVVSDSTRHPLSQADVMLEELGRSATTSEAGAFRIEGIPLGVYTLRVRRIGFKSAFATLRIEAADSVTVELPLRAWIPEMEEILVTARTYPSRDAEIVERHRAGGGLLIGDDKLRQVDGLRLQDVLHDRGVRISALPSGQAFALSSRRPRPAPGSTVRAAPCIMSVYLEGMPVPADLSLVSVQGLRAIEVFKSGLSAPIQYSPAGSDCGVILLWSRDR